MKDCCVLRVPVGFLPEFLLTLSLLIVILVTGGFASVVSANFTVESSSEGLGGVDYGVPHFMMCGMQLHKFFRGEGLRFFRPLLFLQSQFVLGKLINTVVVAVVEQIQLKIVRHARIVGKREDSSSRSPSTSFRRPSPHFFHSSIALDSRDFVFGVILLLQWLICFQDVGSLLLCW